MKLSLSFNPTTQAQITQLQAEEIVNWMVAKKITEFHYLRMEVSNGKVEIISTDEFMNSESEKVIFSGTTSQFAAL